jgi:DNA-binding transcriptional MerR regulator
VTSSAQFLSPSEAAARLGVSTKALRLYEECGLVSPVRSAAGWRTYGPDEIEAAAKIAALRALGLSLAQIKRVQKGDPASLAHALAAHQAMLEARQSDLAATIEGVRALRTDLVRGRTLSAAELALLPAGAPAAAFDLPWPWGGERFELKAIKPLTYIVGPVGSGKTRFAQKLAEILPGAVFIDLDRAPADGAEIEEALAWLIEDGAADCAELRALLASLEAKGPLVVDLVEYKLDEPTQLALSAHLKRRARIAAPLFVMTRSCAILDLSAVGPDEAILLCPANHSPPLFVPAFPGARGYEAVETCLAPPEVRKRTEGAIVVRPQAA